MVTSVSELFCNAFERKIVSIRSYAYTLYMKEHTLALSAAEVGFHVSESAEAALDRWWHLLRHHQNNVKYTG